MDAIRSILIGLTHDALNAWLCARRQCNPGADTFARGPNQHADHAMAEHVPCAVKRNSRLFDRREQHRALQVIYSIEANADDLAPVVDGNCFED